MLDNDSKFPGDSPNAGIVGELTPWVAFVHELARRSIESYLPHSALTRYDRSAPFKEQVDALFRLSEDQRRHYHMKTGFRLKDEHNPTKAAYLASADVSADEKMLFGSITNENWVKLASGFGRKLSEIYTSERFRPAQSDKSVIDRSDVEEFSRLLDAIYERI